MDRANALLVIQRMHQTRTVMNEAITAWYYFYAHQLPKMRPDRSDVDLIRTAALWMELTDRGGSPSFPYEYKSELSFPSISPAESPSPNVTWLLGVISVAVGIIALFFNWRVGLALIIAGPIIHVVGYKITGGPTNPNLMKEGTTLYEKEGRRVIEWASKKSDA